VTRVLHVVRTTAFAGVERYVSVLAAAQRQTGDQVAVIGGDPVAMSSAIDEATVLKVPSRTIIGTAWAIDHWRHCDVIHVHMTAAEVAATAAVRSWGVPVVATRHFGLVRGQSIPGHFVRPVVSRRVAAQISVSRYVAEMIDGTSTVIYPGVPSVPGLTTSSRRAKSILLAQRLEAEKQTDTALEAFARSRLLDHGWVLDIAGVGARAGDLKRLAERLGIRRGVRFLGFRSDIAALMQTAGMLLATSPAEHFGLSVVEAMACGLPVIAAGSAGHLETVGAASNAALYPPGDSDAAAELMRRLAGDPRGRDRYGAELQNLQREKFSVARQVEETAGVYRSVM